MIRLENLYAGYGKKTVLKDINLEFKKGDITTIIGPNGCGKTTLLKSIVGLCDLTCGSVVIDKHNVKSLSNSKRAQKVAYLPQVKSIAEVTVGQLVVNGRFPYLSFPRKYSKTDFEAAKTAMEQIGIFQYAETRLCELSGGLQQKAYIAMALCQQAEAILFDEPTTFLDIAQQFKINEILSDLKHQSKAVVCIIHDIISALKISDKIIVMKNGTVVKEGTPKQIIESDIINEVFGVEICSVGNEYFYKQKGIL